MSANKHTPGPWRFLQEECDRPYIRVRGTQLGLRYKIANVLTPNYDGVASREAEETRANARLIAAAPELLTSLQALADEAFKNMHGGRGDLIDDARAAIAKATGGAS